MFMIGLNKSLTPATRRREKTKEQHLKKKLCSKMLFFPSNLQAKTAAEYLLQIKISIKHLEGASSVGFS